MKTPNLNELATRIHEQNKAAGWWDIPRPRVQTAWLVVTELAEATEAERAGKYTNMAAFETDILDNKRVSREIYGPDPERSLSIMWETSFRRYVKDAFEDEIADAVIRLLDFAGSESIDIVLEPEDCKDYFDEYSTEIAFFSITDSLRCLASNLDGYGGSFELRNINIRLEVCHALGTLMVVAEKRGFDLWHHVDLKLKYNATRPKMHGGKKF
jgi:hypothetical protein